MLVNALTCFDLLKPCQWFGLSCCEFLPIFPADNLLFLEHNPAKTSGVNIVPSEMTTKSWTWQALCWGQKSSTICNKSMSMHTRSVLRHHLMAHTHTPAHTRSVIRHHLMTASHNHDLSQAWIYACRNTALCAVVLPNKKRLIGQSLCQPEYFRLVSHMILVFSPHIFLTPDIRLWCCHWNLRWVGALNKK